MSKCVYVEVKLPSINQDHYEGVDSKELDKLRFEKMLKKFNRKVQKSKILDKYKEHTYFEKPSKKKHDHDRQVKYNIQKENQERCIEEENRLRNS